MPPFLLTQQTRAAMGTACGHLTSSTRAPNSQACRQQGSAELPWGLRCALRSVPITRSSLLSPHLEGRKETRNCPPGRFVP